MIAAQAGYDLTGLSIRLDDPPGQGAVGLDLWDAVIRQAFKQEGFEGTGEGARKGMGSVVPEGIIVIARAQAKALGAG